MKIRTGFVSNSSSSSFVLNKTLCTAEQIEAVRDHVAYASKHFHGFFDGIYAAWEISERESEIMGFTWMNNFDMGRFLEKIGVPDEAVVFDEDD